MDTNGMSPADLSAIMGEKDGAFGSNGAWWIIILFLFLMGGNGGIFGNRNNDSYTQANALMDTNFNNLGQNVNSIANRQYEQANNLTKGLADGFYGTLSAINGAQNAIGGQINNEGRALQQQLANCCCDNRLAVANLSAQTDQQTASIVQAIHSDGEQTRSLIQQNLVQNLRDRISTLEADNRMAGVVRYPMSYSYSAGQSPFCGCGCGNI